MAKLRSLRPLLASIEMRTALPLPKVAEQFYQSGAWRRLVANLIAKRGRRCELCGKTTEADGSPVRLIGDHIRERRDGGADLDPGNVQLLCSRSGGNGAPRQDGVIGNCHAAKTAAAKRARYTRHP